ncbi:MAG: hypothetical protein ACR2N2_12985 [Acidimicrobiia bacterium]
MTSQAIPNSRTRLRARSGPVRGPRVIPLIFFAMLAVALFFAMIYLRIALDRNAFELDRLEREITLEESKQLDLKLEIAQLQDPLRISSEAQRIGLTYPDERLAITVTGIKPAADSHVEQPLNALPGQP